MLSKLTLPRQLNTIKRPKLLNLIDQLSSRQTVWLCAPPGTGKTTLVSDYIQEENLKHIWYRLDPDDSEPGAFFHYLKIAADNLAEQVKNANLIFKPEYEVSLSAFSKRFFERFFLQQSDPVVLVFDDYHELPENSKLNEIFYELIVNLPKDFRTVIISRQSPPKRFARLLINGLLGCIDWEIIKFTKSETEDLLNDRGISDSTEVERLQKQTKGWIAGLILLLGSKKTSKLDIMNHNQVVDYQLMFDYFAAEVFDDYDSSVQNFLLKISLLPHMTVEMCAELSGIDNDLAKEILTELHKNNYFTEQQNNLHLYYQFHPLFRHYLRTQTEERFGSEELQILKQGAADILYRAGQVEAAANLWINTASWDMLATLYIYEAPELLDTGRHKVLHEWVIHIPEEIKSRYIELNYWYACSLSPYAPDNARAKFKTVFESYKEQNDIKGQYLCLATAADTYFYDWSEYTSSDVWMDDIKQIKETHPQSPSLEIEAKMVSGLLACILWRKGHCNDYPWLEDRSYELLTEISDQDQTAMIAFPLLWYHLYKGDTEISHSIVKFINTTIDIESLQPINQIKWYSILANYHYYMGDGKLKIRQKIKLAEEVANKYGIHFLNAMMAILKVYSHLFAEEVDEAEHRLSLYWKAVQPGSRPEFYYHYLVAWKSLMQRDLPAAEQHLNKTFQIAEKLGVQETVFQGYLYYLSGMLKLELEDYKQAEKEFMQLQTLKNKIGSSLLEWMLLLSRAYMAYVLKSDDLKKIITNAIEFGCQYKLMNIPARISRFLEPVYAIALETGIETAYVQNLIKKQNIRPEITGMLTIDWPWKIRVYTLDEFKIEINHKHLEQASGKQQHRPLQLLMLLITQNGKSLSAYRAIEVLWPDVIKKTGEDNLKTTLARLRKLIGKDVIVQKKGNLSFKPNTVWVDAWALTEFSAQLENQADMLEANFGHFDKVSRLYKRHFLFNEELPWIFPMRETIKKQFFHLMELYIHHKLTLGDANKAVELSDLALNIDSINEIFYRYSMKAHIQLNNHTEAAKTYRRCQRILSERLAIEPSAQTKILFASIASTAI